MATFLRGLSYQYPWLYQAIARTTAIAVGGYERFQQLPVRGVTIECSDTVLDLCCGRGEATAWLVKCSDHVIGLDASPKAIAVARAAVPQAQYVEGWAQALPFADDSFDWVHMSVALHEMSPPVLAQIVAEVYRVLRPDGQWLILDFHQPPFWLWPGLALFLWLFETKTAWQMIATDLTAVLRSQGFIPVQQYLAGAGSLQVLQATKPVTPSETSSSHDRS